MRPEFSTIIARLDRAVLLTVCGPVASAAFGRMECVIGLLHQRGDAAGGRTGLREANADGGCELLPCCTIGVFSTIRRRRSPMASDGFRSVSGSRRADLLAADPGNDIPLSLTARHRLATWTMS
jgi:hypothetical protein